MFPHFALRDGVLPLVYRPQIAKRILAGSNTHLLISHPVAYRARAIRACNFCVLPGFSIHGRAMRVRNFTVKSHCSYRRIARTFSIAALGLLTAVLTACGGSSNGNKIYVVGLGTPNVQILAVASSGGLTADTTNLAGTGSRPNAIILARHFAYVLDSTGGVQPGGISEYTISGSGILAAARTSVALSSSTVNATPPKTGLNPLSMVMDSNGKFVFVANQGSNTISVYSVDSSTGLLTEITGSPFATAAGPSGLAMTGNTLFVANQVAGTVSVYSVDQTSGSLTQSAGSPFAAGTSPTALDVDSGGKFLYVADMAANSVLAFSIGSSGQLSTISGSPIAAGTAPVNVRVVGSSVYVANSGSGNVSGYSIGGSGALTAISGSPFTAGANPVYIASASSGALLFVANQGSNSISEFQVGSGGALTAVSGSPFTTVVGNPAAIVSNF
jgi:6-phosphogluconolactonase (cycloisomerase 2 family)